MGSKHFGLTYKKLEAHLQGEDLFYGYADAAYANADHYHSTSGYAFIASRGAITWSSKKQTTVALSSTEAEYVALSEATCKATWLRNLYSELGFNLGQPTLLLGDNDGSIAMAKNPQFHKRAKHIAIRWHYVREKFQDGTIEITDCRDPQNTADILTKALTLDRHSRHLIGLGVSLA